MRGGRGARAEDAGGFVLLTVLLVVLLSSMLAVSLLFAMRADVTAHTAGVQQEQAWAAAMSGVAGAIAVAQGAARGTIPWRDNPGVFQDQFVVRDGDDQWHVTVYSASDAFASEVRFGLTDEAGKFHLAHTDAAWLEHLPPLDGELARALVPGTGTGTARALTEIGRATAASAASSPRTVPAALAAPSLEEWFARAGLNLQWLYGEDVNFNLRLDPNEDDGDTQWPADDRNGQLDIGLQSYLTLYSYESNVDAQGEPRVNLNDPKADLAAADLPPAARTYVEAVRRAGQSLADPSALLEAEGEFKNPAGKTVRLKSGVGKAELATVLDRCTTTAAPRREGLLNVLTAPRALLAAIPALGETLADTIVAARTGLSLEESRTPAWLYQRGVLSADEFKRLAPHLTTRSSQFSFRCVAYAVPSGRYRVLAVVIDVGVRPARILALHDLTRFGFPIPLETLRQTGTPTAWSALPAARPPRS